MFHIEIAVFLRDIKRAGLVLTMQNYVWEIFVSAVGRVAISDTRVSS
jgi:hypothetical protein